eukprot:SAG31_NODE_34426_length_333_cov_0.662393_1_plen_74_part_00
MVRDLVPRSALEEVLPYDLIRSAYLDACESSEPVRTSLMYHVMLTQLHNFLCVLHSCRFHRKEVKQIHLRIRR